MLLSAARFPALPVDRVRGLRRKEAHSGGLLQLGVALFFAQSHRSGLGKKRGVLLFCYFNRKKCQGAKLTNFN